MVARATGTLATVASWENLWLAYGAAARGKRRQAAVARFEYRVEDELLALARELRERRYRPGPYARFSIREPKRRVISAAPFRDRVVHHALCNVIEPRFERLFIPDSDANRPGKGTHRALDRLQAFARRYRYVLRADVVKHFPSIDHGILRATLARVEGHAADTRAEDACRALLRFAHRNESDADWLRAQYAREPTLAEIVRLQCEAWQSDSPSLTPLPAPADAHG